MHGSRLSLLVALAVPAFAPAAQSQGSALPAVQNPFPLVETGEERGVAWLSFDGQSHVQLDEAFAAGESTRLEQFPLPGGRLVDLVLRPSRVMPEGAMAQVVGVDGTTWLAPTVSTFGGHVEGGGQVFLGISSGMVNGYIQIGDDLWILSSNGTTGALAVSHASAFPEGDETAREWCQIATADAGDPHGVQLGGSGPIVRLTDVFLELDNDYRLGFINSTLAIDYALTLIAASNEIYRRDVGAVMSVPNGFLRLWTMDPPWGPISTFNDIFNVQSWWSSPFTNPDDWDAVRAAVHVLTRPVFGGVAYSLNGLCSQSSGYDISSVYGSFPYPPILHTNDSNWDLLVVTHEFGHTFGSPHTFDYAPPISCTDGSGPDSGTLMSYCHQNPGGVANVGMRFHDRVQTVIRNDVGNAGACFVFQPIQLGDYDYDGSLGNDDLAAYDAYVAQGFDSQGAFETFDMDDDGSITPADRALLVAAINDPGNAFCFGTGCPCGNDGTGNAGCDNPQSTGGVELTVSNYSPDLLGGGTATMNGNGFPGGSNPTAIVIRSALQEPTPATFGDGLRCVSTNGLVRLAATTAVAGGSSHSINHGAGAGTFVYQIWYRSNPATFCNPEAFNLSNGYELNWP